MRIYVSKKLKKEGITADDARKIVNIPRNNDPEKNYVSASLLYISWKPTDAAQLATLAFVIVLTDAKKRKQINLHYYYKNGAPYSPYSIGKFIHLYGLYRETDRRILKTLPPHLKKVVRNLH